MSITKTAQSLTAQLKDVAQAFCLEVWNEALNAAGVSAKSNLSEAYKVYYSPALCIAPNSAPPSPNPRSVSSVPKSTTTSTTPPYSGKEKEQPTPTPIVELESGVVVKVEQLKMKKKNKEKEITA